MWKIPPVRMVLAENPERFGAVLFRNVRPKSKTSAQRFLEIVRESKKIQKKREKVEKSC